MAERRNSPITDNNPPFPSIASLLAPGSVSTATQRVTRSSARQAARQSASPDNHCAHPPTIANTVSPPVVRSSRELIGPPIPALLAPSFTPSVSCLNTSIPAEVTPVHDHAPQLQSISRKREASPTNAHIDQISAPPVGPVRPPTRRLKRQKISESPLSSPLSLLSPTELRPLKSSKLRRPTMSNARASPSSRKVADPSAALMSSTLRPLRKKPDSNDHTHPVSSSDASGSGSRWKQNRSHHDDSIMTGTEEAEKGLIPLQAPTSTEHNLDNQSDEINDDEPQPYNEPPDDNPFNGSLESTGSIGPNFSHAFGAIAGLMNTSMSARLRDILNRLRQKNDPSVQLIALQELSEIFLVSNEDNLSGYFSPDPFVKEIVSLMQMEASPEIMLLACRSIANLLEALPSSVANVVYGGVVPILCQKLLEISFIDLAEQALGTLEKISVDYPASIVREGGLTACLSYLDFFPTSTQRTAVTTAANCCRNIPSDSFSTVKDVMPILQNIFGSSDQRVTEQASLCVTGIVESFRRYPEKLEQLITVNLLRIVLRLLAPGTNNVISPGIYTQLLRMLSFTAHASPQLSAELLKLNTAETLYQIFTGISPPSHNDVALKPDSVVVMQALIHRPLDQIIEALNVICELLPQFSSQRDPFAKSQPSPEPFPLPAGSESKSKHRSINARRIELLEECGIETRRFALTLFPILIDVYMSTVNLSVRQKVLTAQIRMLSNVQQDVLLDALASVPYASFLTSILSQVDHPFLAILALHATELLLSRLNEVYRYQLYREGVISEVTRLANTEDQDEVEVHPDDSADEGGRSSAQDESDGENEEHHSSGNDEEGEDNKSEGDDEDDEEDDDDGNEHDASEDEHVENRHQVDHLDEEEDDPENEDEDDDDDQELEHDNDGSESASGSHASTSLSGPVHDYTTNLRAMRTRIKAIARMFLEKHELGTHNSAKSKASTILLDISELLHSLEELYVRGTYSEHTAELGRDLFRKLASYFSADVLENITSAELLTSGFIRVMLNILGQHGSDLSCHARATFLEIFMSGHVNARAIPGGGLNSSTNTPFGVMTHKLQDVLSRSEQFEVLTAHHNTVEGNRSSPTTLLAKQIKLRLAAQDETEIPKAFRNVMVSIHAIATFKSLEDYLRPRLAIHSRARASRAHTISRPLAASPSSDGGSPDSFSARMSEQPSMENLSPPELARHQSHPETFATRTLRKSKARISNISENLTASSSLARMYREKATLRRSTRRSVVHSDIPVAPILDQHHRPDLIFPTPALLPDNDEVARTLSCMKEKPETDVVAKGGKSLGELAGNQDTIGGNATPDPAAVSVEVFTNGKTTVRRDDGSRVLTPLQRHSASISRANTGLTATPILISSLSGRAMSYAAAMQSIPQDWHMEFSLDGKVIPTETTIYRAIHMSTASDTHSSRTIWTSTHTINFRRLPGPPRNEPLLSSASNNEMVPENGSEGTSGSLSNHPLTASILQLLNILHDLNANIDDVLLAENKELLRPLMEPLTQFVNPKITAKLNRQLEEPLIVASSCLPGWCEDLARLFPFLFPFETRYVFLQSTSFGYARSMSRWQSNQGEENRRDRRDDRPFLGRLQRQKVRISRSRILESAVKVMELYGASQSILEVEYFEEVGTGLGPTLEFYSTISKEFAKKKLKLWREMDSYPSSEFISGRTGLFPRPLSNDEVNSANGERILHLFKMLGKFVARSMMDSRIIDINFNPIFFKLDDEPLSSTLKPSLSAIRTVDPGLAQSLKAIKALAICKQTTDGNPKLTPAEKAAAAELLAANNARLEDLCLDFTLPGYPEIELLSGGSHMKVSIDNVALYIERVLDMTLGAGVSHQIEAFRAGFSQVFPYPALKSFTPGELVNLFGQSDEDWSLETLTDSIKADHGYNMDSRSVQNLLQVMSQLNGSERRLFLQFTTGSPKLPIGGFRSLSPMFTVVLRIKEHAAAFDTHLPSVMTCANYLKLPDYSSIDILRTRLMIAIREGQGAFHLS